MPEENLERRFIPLDACELRASKDGKLAGYAAVFNKRSSDLGGFREQISPGAFTDALAGKPDVVATIDHEGGLSLLGRTPNTLGLSEDKTGLHYELNLPPTQAGKDVTVLVDRGDIRGSSFAFRVAPGGDSWAEDPDGTMVRTINKIARLSDVSVVTRPAYPDTSVACRSLDEFRAAKAAAVKPPEKPKTSAEALRMRLEVEKRRG